MVSLKSFIRALLKPSTRARRPTARRPLLVVEFLERRALPSTSPVLTAVHPGADDVQHRRVEHGPEFQIEHGIATTGAQSQVNGDRGVNRQLDGANDKNDDRGVNRQQDGVNDQNDDRGAHRGHHGGIAG